MEQPAIRRYRGRRGAALVEFTLVLSLLSLLLFGTVEMGFLFRDQAAISQAAREAARSAALGSTTSVVKTRAINTAAGVTLTNSNITLEKSTDNGATWTALGDSGSTNNGSAGDLVRTTVTYSHGLISSLIFTGGTKTLTAKMVMRHE